MPISQNLLPEFDSEMANTRKFLERVPDGQFDYKPHPKSMPLGRLATHVAELPSWAKMTLETESLDFDPNTYKPNTAANQAELVTIFDKSVAEAREKLSAAEDEDWHKIWSLKSGGHTVFALPRVAVMRSVVMNHLIHHRAQLGVYLRMLDVPVPGPYGPSADER
jgi:uncharacterized damage-inducible protein DinB